MQNNSFDLDAIIKNLKRSSFSEKIKEQDLKKVEKVSGDASSRQYFRIRTKNKNYILCLDGSYEGPSNNNHFRKVQKVLKHNGIRVPELYKTNLDPNMILEQDLGDQTLRSLLAEKNNDQDEFQIYKSCLDILMMIHQIDPQKYQGETFTNLFFDHIKLMEEINFTIEHFLMGFLGVKLTQRDIDILQKYFLQISHLLADGPFVLTHRDFHSKNIMCYERELFVIDFQDIRMGLPHYDLVSILEDCYYQVRRENVNKLKKYYFDNFIVANNLKGKGDFEKLYDYMTIQRTFKAIGSFSFVFMKKGDPRFLKYIGFGMEKIKEKLSRYPELEILKKNLFKYYYGN